MTGKLGEERGAILIQVTVVMIGLLTTSSFVIDYGVLWAARRQAQNAADSAALSGAISMGLKNPGDFQIARDTASSVGQTNYVFGITPTINAGTGDSCDEAQDISFPYTGDSCGHNFVDPDGTNHCPTSGSCVRANVYRNEARNPLPTFFIRLAGMTEQGVKATATAEVGSGNEITCLLPFAIMDRWADNYDNKVTSPIDGLPGIAGWTQNDDYQQAQGDVYVPPYPGNVGMTGWTIANDYGHQFVLKDGSPTPYSSGWFSEVDLPNSTGSKDYSWNIQNCNESPVGIANAGEACNVENDPVGCVSIKTGASQGPTVKHGIDVLVQDDPGAYWDPSLQGPDGQQGAVAGGQGMDSPRIRPMVVLDIGNYMGQNCNGTTCIGKVANILGFFVEGVCKNVTMDPGVTCDDPNKDVVGRIVTVPGSDSRGAGGVQNPASFVKVIRLIR